MQTQKNNFSKAYFFLRHDDTSTWFANEIPTVPPLPYSALACLKFMSISIANVLVQFTPRFSGWCNRTTWDNMTHKKMTHVKILKNWKNCEISFEFSRKMFCTLPIYKVLLKLIFGQKFNFLSCVNRYLLKKVHFSPDVLSRNVLSRNLSNYYLQKL